MRVKPGASNAERFANKRGDEDRVAKLHDAVTAEDHGQGDEKATVTLLEYGDYQCPHCAMAHAVVKRVMKHYAEDVRFVFRNFPLDMHPMAEPAAEAAEFAGSKGRFWKMHDAIFEHQDELSVATLVALAKKIGLDGNEAEEAIDEGTFAERIERDVKGGEESGVHGTPTFFVNGVQHTGAFGFEELTAAIDEVRG